MRRLFAMRFPIRRMRLVDVNPIENPYADGAGYVSPPQGAPSPTARAAPRA